MKIYGEMETQFHAFMTLVTDGGISRFTIDRPPSTHLQSSQISGHQTLILENQENKRPGPIFESKIEIQRTEMRQQAVINWRHYTKL
jgi:hypothetical protein